MPNNYYDKEKFDKVFDDFFHNIEKYGKKNPFHDAYLSYLEIPQDVKDKKSLDYEIDLDAYLFHLIRILGISSKNEKRKLLKHPYIHSLIVKNRMNHLHTTFGDVDFEYIVKGFSDIIVHALIDSVYSGDLYESYTLFRNEYVGAYYQSSHKSSMLFCGTDDIVTAFIHSPLNGYSFLHSFVESNGHVLETTSNIVMDKDDYYGLAKPDIITRIPGEELYELYLDYPRLKYMSLKQLLVEYDEVKKNPEAIKIKTLRNK